MTLRAHILLTLSCLQSLAFQGGWADRAEAVHPGWIFAILLVGGALIVAADCYNNLRRGR